MGLLVPEDKTDKKSQESYIELLRGLFKGGPAQRFISLAYLTGILPIKKYGTQSALNNFKEYTMVRPKVLAEYVGFTEPEVQKLCERYGMDLRKSDGGMTDTASAASRLCTAPIPCRSDEQ